MFREAIWYYLLFVPHLLMVGVVVAIYRRKLYRRHPIFFAYCLYEVVEFPVAVFGIFSKAVSFDQYWFLYDGLLCGSVLLRFGVIYELFSNLSTEYPSLRRFSKVLFRGLLVVLLFIALGLVAFSWPGNPHILNRFITFVLDRAVNLLQLGLLLGLFGIAKFFGLSWRRHIFGITLGLAMYLSVQLIATAVQAEWGFLKIFDYLTMATYHVSVLVWLLYVLIPEPKPALTSLPEHADVSEWNTELAKLLRV
jgi:hypothetical protein